MSVLKSLRNLFFVDGLRQRFSIGKENNVKQTIRNSSNSGRTVRPFRFDRHRSWLHLSNRCSDCRNWSRNSWSRGSQGRLVQVGSSYRKQSIRKNSVKAAVVTGIAMFLSLSVAIPANAEVINPPSATTLPGWVYEAPAVSNYMTETRWECAEGAVTIFDCKFYMWFHGKGYDAINTNLNKPSNNADGSTNELEVGVNTTEAPIVSYAFMTVWYNARNGSGSPQRVMLTLTEEIQYDYNTGRARAIFDLSDFFFDDWSDPSDSWGWEMNRAQILMSPENYQSACGGYTSDQLPLMSTNPMRRYDKFLVTCAVGGELSHKSPPSGTPAPLPFNQANAGRALSMSIDVVKAVKIQSPSFEEGLVNYFIGDGVNFPGIVSYGEQHRHSVAYPLRDNWGALTKSTCAVTVEHNWGWSSGDGTTTVVSMLDDQQWKTPNDSRVLTWFPTQPASNSCLRTNTARYVEFSVTGILNNPEQHVDPGTIDEIEDNENIAEVDPGEWIRPKLVDCININPLEFKWDWPCIWDIWFLATPAKLNAVNNANEDVLTRVPFNYYALFMDAVNKIFVDAGVCTPWSYHMSISSGMDIPLWLCDGNMRNIVRPMTNIGLSLMIIGVVGPWVIRKFWPSFGSSE